MNPASSVYLDSGIVPCRYYFTAVGFGLFVIPWRDVRVVRRVEEYQNFIREFSGWLTGRLGSMGGGVDEYFSLRVGSCDMSPQDT